MREERIRGDDKLQIDSPIGHHNMPLMLLLIAVLRKPLNTYFLIVISKTYVADIIVPPLALWSNTRWDVISTSSRTLLKSQGDKDLNRNKV